VREYSPADQLSTVHLPFGTRDAEDAKRYRQDFTRDARGRVSSIDAPYEWTNPSAKTSRTTYTHYETGWTKTQTDPKLVDPDTQAPVYDQTLTYAYDPRGNQTLWRSDQGREVRRRFAPNDTLSERSAEKPGADRSYAYAYNENRSMTAMEDRQLTRTTRYAYDAAERETLVDETWAGGKDTRSAYDQHGNAIERETDGSWATPEGSAPRYEGGKATSYAYDPLDREHEMGVAEAGAPGVRTTRTEYHPSGELARKIKPNGVNEYTSFASDGRLSHMRRGMGAAAAPGKNLPYAYDRNGNRTNDERGTHAYNARDQLRTWTRASGGAVSYEHDGSGAVTRRTEGTDTESFAYNGERLMSSTRGGATKRYAYDEFGSMTKEGANLENPETTYSYDAFERLTGGRGPGQAADTSYRYDGLDRRDYRTENGTRYDSSYVGSSEVLAREQDPGKTQTYDYDSAGQSQGQATSRLGASTYRSFAKDANGSVEGLEGALGEITPASRYDYDPYGKLENEQAILDPAAKDNPIRFEGFRYDSGLKTYDMQARQYRPDIGRFLTQDRFESASGDLNLQSDPLTQNRYAFAGGNPVSRVEWDGHRPRCSFHVFVRVRRSPLVPISTVPTTLRLPLEIRARVRCSGQLIAPKVRIRLSYRYDYYGTNFSDRRGTRRKNCSKYQNLCALPHTFAVPQLCGLTDLPSGRLRVILFGGYRRRGGNRVGFHRSPLYDVGRANCGYKPGDTAGGTDDAAKEKFKSRILSRARQR